MFDVPLVLPDDSPRVRKADPVTSHEAADSNDAARSRVMLLKYMAYFENGVAQFEAEKGLATEFSPSRVRSAFTELEALGKVERTADFRTTPSGRRAQVWALA